MQVKTIVLKAENWIHTISKSLHYISAFVLFLLMTLMTIDVISRYVFKHAITGSIDLVVLMMVLFIFLSFPNTAYRRKHVRTDVVYERLSPTKKAFFDIVTIGLSALIMLLISWQLGARALNIMQNPPGLSTSYFCWPHFPFIMLAAICCGLVCLELVIWVIQSIHSAIKH